jgi:uncharacterized delta-60 repeat protein
MVGTGKSKKRRNGASVLLILFILGLTCLALPAAAESGVTTAWVRSYQDPGYPVNEAAAMALDGQGNVYITGRSGDYATDFDCLTVKYSPSGDLLWTRRYNGPAGGYDEPKAIAVDSQGNIYVAGTSLGFWTDDDFLTIKYSPDGQELWVRREKGPDLSWGELVAMAVDSQDNVYVTGYSGYFGTLTIKYDTNGQRLWRRYYDKAEARAMSVDAQGNVYIAGEGFYSKSVTIKYDTNGRRVWVRKYQDARFFSTSGIALDGQGNVAVTGTLWRKVENFLTIKYSSEGQRLWVRRYHGPETDFFGEAWNEARAIAADAQGNVYVTGYTQGPRRWSLLGYDSAFCTTIKYSPGGRLLWARHYAGRWPGWSFSSSIFVDALDNVYVTGSSDVSEGERDYATLKYSSEGQLIWGTLYHSPGQAINESLAIRPDGQGNVYVTGYSSDEWGDNSHYLTIKYTQIP